MADNDQNNDEYQFTDLDTVNPDEMEENFSASSKKEGGSDGSGKNIRRNALIAVAIAVLALLVYKFMGSIFSEKKDEVPPTTQTTPPPVIQPTVTQPVVTQPPPSVITTTPVIDTSSGSKEVNQKLSELEASQQSVSNEVSTMSNQLSGLGTNMSDLADKIATLSQTVNVLAAKVDQQSQEIAVLTARTAPKVVKRPPRPATTRIVYYIQAVIPGRAWLIATNGSTLTVREGTIVPGFGVVKLIDPKQGRVVMSTGQIIRFSQQDS